MIRPEDIDTHAIRGTVAISLCARSGSYLLSNLFDSHPEILSCPPHALDKGPLHANARLKEAVDGGQSFDELIDGISNLFPALFSETDHSAALGPSYKKMKFGVKHEIYKPILARVLTRTLRDHGNINVDDVFAAIHLAYAEALGRKLRSAHPYIIWQKHTPVQHREAEFHGKFLKNLTWITAVRSPLRAIDSQLVHRFNDVPIGGRNETYKFAFYFFCLAALKKNLPFPQYAVRFEDMHRQTEQTMRALCALLGIEFDPILLETTLDGDAFLFPKGSGFITGVNPQVVEDDGKYTELTESEVPILKRLLRPYCETYGYKGLLQDDASPASQPDLPPDSVFDRLLPISRATSDDFPQLIVPVTSV